MASLLDLAAQKVRMVQVRAERKDYLDLATLMAHGIALPAALALSLSRSVMALTRDAIVRGNAFVLTA